MDGEKKACGIGCVCKSFCCVFCLVLIAAAIIAGLAYNDIRNFSSPSVKITSVEVTGFPDIDAIKSTLTACVTGAGANPNPLAAASACKAEADAQLIGFTKAGGIKFLLEMDIGNKNAQLGLSFEAFKVDFFYPSGNTLCNWWGASAATCPWVVQRQTAQVGTVVTTSINPVGTCNAPSVKTPDDGCLTNMKITNTDDMKSLAANWDSAGLAEDYAQAVLLPPKQVVYNIQTPSSDDRTSKNFAPIKTNILYWGFKFPGPLVDLKCKVALDFSKTPPEASTDKIKCEIDLIIAGKGLGDNVIRIGENL